MSGRTIWFPKDAAWWRRTRVVELGQEHGPVGPAVVDWLTCEAKTQNPARGGDGTVKAGYAAIAHGVFSDPKTVKDVVRSAVTIGLLDDFEESDRTFTARISGWGEDVERPLAAVRKARQRNTEKLGDNGGHLGTDGEKSPDVPDSHEDTDRTKDKDPPKPPQGGNVVKFARKTVPRPTVELAEQLLAYFNDRAGTRYGPYTATGKPSESLKRIIGALMERPSLDLAEGKRMTDWRLANPFWEGAPDTGVVWGPKVVEGNRASIAMTANGTTVHNGQPNRFSHLDDPDALDKFL